MAITKVSAALVDLDGGVVINESSADADFRVESNGNTHMLFVDGGNDCVSIGASTDLTGALNITHGSEFGLVTSGGYNFQAKFESTDAEAAIVIEDSNSGTDYNRIGVITNDMAFTTNNSESMRIDSSGNVGIRNSSPSSLNSLGGNSLVIGDGTQNNNLFLYSATTGGTVGYGHIAFADSNANGSSAQYAGLIQYYHGDNSMAFYTGSAKRMTIDSSGDVKIGTSTSAYAFAQKLIVGDANDNDGITIQSGTTHQGNVAFNDGGTTAKGRISYQQSTNYFEFLVNNAVRLKINTNGRQAYSGSGTINAHATFVGEVGVGSRALAFEHTVGGGEVGTIVTGSSSTTYNTSSDYRLKENVDYSWDATTRLKQLKPARFNFIADETNTLIDGFLAHEVSSVVPHAIYGEKDAMGEALLYEHGDEIPEGKSVGDVKKAAGPDYQQIDHSKLVPLLVKTIQELEARVTTLEG